MNEPRRSVREKRARNTTGVSNAQLIEAGILNAPLKPKKRRAVLPENNFGNMNQNNKEGISLNALTGNIRYRNVMKNIQPYIQSRIWSRYIKKRANISGYRITNADKIPTKEMVYTALATSLGMRYITTGRGGAAEDAPFLPKVAAIPVIPRKLWSTDKEALNTRTVNAEMKNLWGAFGKNNSRNRINARASRLSEPQISRGAISNFYKPAFTQICTHDGEWLVNGFKVDKTRVQKVAADVLKSQD